MQHRAIEQKRIPRPDMQSPRPTQTRAHTSAFRASRRADARYKLHILLTHLPPLQIAVVLQSSLLPQAAPLAKPLLSVRHLPLSHLSPSKHLSDKLQVALGLPHWVARVNAVLLQAKLAAHGLVKLQLSPSLPTLLQIQLPLLTQRPLKLAQGLPVVAAHSPSIAALSPY